jgi:lipoprotein-releasing system permease protein
VNLDYFIAKRLHFAFEEGKRNVSRPAVRVATVGVAVGLAVMIVAVSVIVGFKTEVAGQVIGFGSHIQVSAFGAQTSYERPPIVLSDMMMQRLAALPNISALQRIITKPAIIKTDSAFHAIVIKGIDNSYRWNFFRRNLIAGDTLAFDSLPSNGVIISQTVAEKLGLTLGDSFNCYFMQETVRARKMVINGIYATTFSEYDRLFVLADLRIAALLNEWDSSQISTLEILIDDFDRLDATATAVYQLVGNHFDSEGQLYQTRTIKQIAIQIFEWLDRLDLNAWVILMLMLIVAGFTMVSGLLILILERTATIGILKALGASNWAIRRMFLYHASFLVGKGMLMGNIVGVGIVLAQYFFHIIPLDASFYYVNYVPVSVNAWLLLAINAGTFLLSLAMMIIPTWFITKITPVEAMHFD